MLNSPKARQCKPNSGTLSSGKLNSKKGWLGNKLKRHTRRREFLGFNTSGEAAYKTSS
jgi:hypothetical protein